MNNLHKFFFILLFSLVISAQICPKDLKYDPLAADEISGDYRTGVIDPVIGEIPKGIQENVFIKPEEYLPKLVDFLMKGADNDFHKIKRIHDWITDNIAYNTDDFYDIGEGTGKPYELLKEKMTTCGGYSRLFLEMTKFAGIEAVYIYGYSKSYISKNGKARGHAWNAVKINGKWYIVDTTHDGRFSYFKKKLSEKSGYRDNYLFLNPRVKIMINFPEKEEYQFLEKPVSKEEFFSGPKYNAYYFKYGINFITDINNMIRPYQEIRTGGNLISLYDMIESTGNIIKIEAECPTYVRMMCSLKDIDRRYLEGATNEENDQIDEVKTYREHFYYYLDKNKYVFYFTAPEKGVYSAKIYAKFDGIDKSYQNVYTFILKENKSVGELLPKPFILYTKPNFYKYGLKINENNLDRTDTSKYYKLDIEYPENAEIISSLRDKDDKVIDNAICYSFFKNRKIYYYSVPDRGTYFIKLHAKFIGEESYGMAIESKIVNNDPTGGPELPPPGILIYKTLFTKNDFRLLDENIDERDRNGPYKLRIKCPPQFTSYCKLKDKNDKAAEDYYAYTINDGIYTYYFSTPDDNEYIAKIYQVDNENKINTIMEFKIKNNRFNEKLPLPDELCIVRRFVENSHRLLAENVSDRSNSGIYTLKIKAKNGIYLSCDMRNEKNEKARGYYEYSRINDTYEFYFGRPKERGVYTAKIYDRNEKNLYNTIAYFKITSDGSGSGEIPPPNTLCLYNLFYESGFRLLSSSINDKNKSYYDISVLCPPDFSLKASVYDEENKTHNDKITTKKDGEAYNFIINISQIGEYLVKIYRVDKNKKMNTIALFRFIVKRE